MTDQLARFTDIQDAIERKISEGDRMLTPRHALACAQVYHLVAHPDLEVQVLHLTPNRERGYAVLALPASVHGVVIDHGLTRDLAEDLAAEARACIRRLNADRQEAIRRG